MQISMLRRIEGKTLKLVEPATCARSKRFDAQVRFPAQTVLADDCIAPMRPNIPAVGPRRRYRWNDKKARQW